MGKIIYTERDVELLAARGVREIPVNDDVIVTGVAREKMDKLGMKLRFVGPGEAGGVGPGTGPGPAGPGTPPAGAPRPEGEQESLVAQAKAAVLARLGPGVDAVAVDKAVRAVLDRMRRTSA